MNGGDGGICVLNLEAIWSSTEAFDSHVFKIWQAPIGLKKCEKYRERYAIYISI